jgi:hypothetical protein
LEQGEYDVAISLSREFWVSWIGMCSRLGCNPIDLAKIAYSESGLNPAAYNKDGPAGGLIQFMQVALRGVGYSGSVLEFTKLPAIQQIPYIEKYYSPFRSYLTDPGLMYTVNFLPAYTGAAARDWAAGKDYVYAVKGATGYSGTIYKYNPGLDANKDGKISHADLLAHIARVTSTMAWKAVEDDIKDAQAWIETGHSKTAEPQRIVFNWRAKNSIRQVQSALNRWFISSAKLKEDGVFGPKTKTAVMDFQTQLGLYVDGLPGPKTRKKMAEKLLQLRAQHH